MQRKQDTNLWLPGSYQAETQTHKQVGQECLAPNCCRRALWNCNPESEGYLLGEGDRQREGREGYRKRSSLLKGSDFHEPAHQ